MNKTFCGMCAYTLTVLGVLFLLRDLNVWDFWNVQWWTALFLLMGVSGLAGKGCCDSGCSTDKKK